MAEPLRADPPPAYAVRRSERARRVRVAVQPDGAVVVTLPRSARERDAALAVAELRGWIERRQAEAVAARSRARALAPPGTIRLLDEQLALVPEPGRVRVHRRGEALLVPGDATARAAALERFYRREAQQLVPARVAEAAAAVGRPVTRITIRNQRTRWGSCSAQGALAFNWRLLLAPSAVLDYVVWHEACHLVHLDHSPRFWALVERHRPGFRAPQAWLRDNGAALVLPG